MWLMTNFGFFSFVQKPGDELLTLRSRVKMDLETLRATPESDCQYRARVQSGLLIIERSIYGH